VCRILGGGGRQRLISQHGFTICLFISPDYVHDMFVHLRRAQGTKNFATRFHDLTGSRPASDSIFDSKIARVTQSKIQDPSELGGEDVWHVWTQDQGCSQSDEAEDARIDAQQVRLSLHAHFPLLSLMIVGPHWHTWQRELALVSNRIESSTGRLSEHETGTALLLQQLASAICMTA